jgi:probable HAF family extracellular repeat protein
MDRRSLVTAGLLTAAATVVGTLGAPPAATQGPGYTLTVLEAPGVTNVTPRGINASGQVAGAASFNGGRTRAFRWTPATPNGAAGAFKDLGTLKGYDWSAGRALNSTGDVTGTGGKGEFGVFGGPSYIPHALLWSGTAGALLLGPSSEQTEGYAINDARQVVGWYPQQGAFLSQVVSGKRKLFIIGEGTANGINNSGQIVVTQGANGPYIFTITGPGTGTRTELTGGAEAHGINEAGQVAGSLGPTLILAGDGITQWRAYRPGLYLAASAYGLNAGWNDLGHPATSVAQGEWVVSVAQALNNQGLVVGASVAYDLAAPGPSYPATARTVWAWDPTNGMRDLNVLVAGSGWNLERVWGVNDAGQIVGTGRLNGQPRGFLLRLL